ncbi:hypothetical protein FB451DRAFT_1513562, partial [Mycena latifolia]
MLRTRIEELSLAIEQQKQILRDLDRRKSDAQRDLNVILDSLDPMARLPLEISSNIFTRCLPSIPQPNPSTAPMVFLNVSHLWSHIALSTPSLWTTIHVDSP